MVKLRKLQKRPVLRELLLQLCCDGSKKKDVSNRNTQGPGKGNTLLPISFLLNMCDTN